MIIMQNLSKVYPGEGVTALDDVSFYVEKGSFCAVVGSSGSGKSTLMNIAGCLDVPTVGKYYLDDEDVGKLNTKRLAHIRNQKIGFVFQSFNLIKGLTALENAVLPLVFSGVPLKQRNELGFAALERVGLKDRAFHKANQLSGGQQQRVAIARAILQKPPLILADEPTGNLDPTSGKEVLDLLLELNREGSTILMITHDWQLARLAHKIMRIENGKLYQTLQNDYE